MKVECGLLVLDALALSGERERSSGGVLGEPTDLDVLEEALRIGACLSEPAWELWQSSADERHGELTLSDAMEGREQRLQVLLLGELHLVEEECYAALSLAGCLAKLDQDILEIDIQLPAVTASRSRGDIDLERDPSGHSCDREAADDRQRPAQPLPDTLPPCERLRGLHCHLSKRWTQRSTAAQLDVARAPSSLLGLRSEAVQ